MSFTRTVSFAKSLPVHLAGTSLLALAAFNATPAQALVITGSVSGIWDSSYYSVNIAPGQTFTATYSYDDASLVPYNYSNPGQQWTGWSAPLLSLSLASGSSSHTFDFTQGYGYIVFQDYSQSAPYSPYNSRYLGITGYDENGSIANYFTAYRQQAASDGVPFDNVYAYGYLGYDYTSGTFDLYGSTNTDVTFTPDPTTTAVPTPVLVPGLIGWSLALLRKRKDEAIEEAVEV